MIDVSKINKKEPTDWKEYTKCVLIALLPAVILTELLREMGVHGFLPTVIPIFGGAEIVRVIRRRRHTATGRSLPESITNHEN